MKRKPIALLLAVLLLLPCLAIPTFADDTIPKDVDVRSIPGIDYDRITQKADGGKKSYPVELNLGELTFNGQLKGDVGLDINEINDIINKTLKEKNLTPSRVALISQLGKQVSRDAALQWGSQVIEGILSYIPSLPGAGIDDYFRYVVYGETKSLSDIGISSVVAAVEDSVELALNHGVMKMGKVFGKTIKKVPMFGAVVNTIKTAVDWKKGNSRLDTYLEDLSKAQADVVDFYAACSRRANDLAESKGTNTWRIEFNDCYETYGFNMWGISGLMMGVSLNGTLTSFDDRGGAGTYTGVLAMVFEGVDMANSFDRDFFKKTDLAFKMGTTYWAGTGLEPITDTAKQTTVLKRTVSGLVTVTVNNGSGIVTAGYNGNIKANDKTEFSFHHTISADSKVGDRTYFWSEAVMDVTASDTTTHSYTDEVHSYTHKYSDGSGPITERVLKSDKYENLPANDGTVWKPLESEPTVFINFGTKS